MLQKHHREKRRLYRRSIKYLDSRSLTHNRVDVIDLGRQTEKWISSLIGGLDKHVDEETRAVILEQCGRRCQSQSFIKKVKGIYEKSNNIAEFLDRLGKVYKHLHREGEKTYLVYPRCYCPQVNRIPKGGLSGTYCNCSRGWAKALFEGALGRPVEVIREKSIINGDNECRFRVVL
jgi:predicted ArsR family transcriptional regulator